MTPYGLLHILLTYITFLGNIATVLRVSVSVSVRRNSPSQKSRHRGAVKEEIILKPAVP